MRKMGAICSDVRVNGDGSEETVIDASCKDEYGRPIDFRSLNAEIRNAMSGGAKRIVIEVPRFQASARATAASFAVSSRWPIGSAGTAMSRSRATRTTVGATSR